MKKNIVKDMIFLAGLILLTGLALISFSLVLLFITGESAVIKKSQVNFFQEQLLPIQHFIESTKEKLGRLPTNEEFVQWHEVHFPNRLIVYYSKKPSFVSSWGDKGESYLIGGWAGDDILYYCSWDKTMFHHDLD